MKWVSEFREVRLRALGEKLATCDYDLICLQELWVYDDYLYIQSKIRYLLPYSHFYFAGFLGSGLAIFSRWPILSTSMYPFGLNGRPIAIWRGDWYAGKGVGTALIRHPSGTLMEVFNTHVCLQRCKLI
jgi:sphingomyelin phosphodiesterase 2